MRLPSLLSNVAFATVIRNNRSTPYCSMSNSGFCTSISVLSSNMSSFGEGKLALTNSVFVCFVLSFSRRILIRFAMASGFPILEKVDKSSPSLTISPASSNNTVTGNRSIATTSALAILPAVKILLPRRPCPVLASGKSPLADRRRVKNSFGTFTENNPSGSINSLSATLDTSTPVIMSSANAAGVPTTPTVAQVVASFAI
mmetsp:Transcript_3136/g.5709  ORF Transcript_3136/g.5709 Transcript_3136/m.5709 type:complete len:201 (-) Transcript_3136:641-1243(-)